MTLIRKCFFIFVCISLAMAGTSTPVNKAKADAKNMSNPWEEEDWPIVVELFTSPECPECKIFDSILYKISNDKNVIALGCHMGNLDSAIYFTNKGAEDCTHRQWYYAFSSWSQDKDLYTPEFVVNGSMKIRRVSSKKVYERLRNTPRQTFNPYWVTLEKKDDNKIWIRLPQGEPEQQTIDESYGVWLIRYQNSEIVKTRSKDGKGQVSRYTNVVKQIEHVGRWYGQKRTLKVDLNLFDPERIKNPGGWVVTIQKFNGDTIVAAGKLADPTKNPRTEQPAEQKNP